MTAARLQGEDRLVAWLRAAAGPQGDLLGDDAAFLSDLGDVAVTVDTQTEGVHFLGGLDPARMAERLVAVNLSDLAACGAKPALGFLALNVPANFDHRRFLRSTLAAARRHGFRLAGGDVARAERPSATLTLIGKRPRGGRWVRRDAARPGDRLWVGGTLGEAAAGLLLQQAATRRATRRSGPGALVSPPSLAGAARRAVARHLAPRAQLALGRWLGRQPRAAALDISDGLGRDLARLCRASGVGALVDASRLPTAPRFAALCAALHREPLELELTGGEDYVLLFTLPAKTSPPAWFRATEIGRMQRGGALRLELGGKIVPLSGDGFDHLRL